MPEMTTGTIVVRDAQEKDRESFLAMWADFVSLAPGEPGNHTMGDLNWSRAMDATHTIRCIVAVDAVDTPVGFTLYSAFPFTWSKGEVCYLQDIYVKPESRGKRVAQTMIEHLRQLGLKAGWFKIFWMTQLDNYDAQRVYDKVARRMDYLRYDLNVCDP